MSILHRFSVREMTSALSEHVDLDMGQTRTFCCQSIKSSSRTIHEVQLINEYNIRNRHLFNITENIYFFVFVRGSLVSLLVQFHQLQILILTSMLTLHENHDLLVAFVTVILTHIK